MPALSEHINVWNTCLRIMRQRGFELRIHSDEPDADMQDCVWCAEKNGYDLWASNPIELLGLVTIYEHRSPEGPPEPYWWVVKGEDIFDELVSKKWPDG